MTTKQIRWAGALLAWAVIPAFAASEATKEVTLKVGSPAPKLQTGKWVQGDAVKDFQSGKAYIVEFWATWCGPCRVSIPHLNEIHEKYKDKGLVVIGQDCWEREEDLVEPFIKKMGEKMTYRVALDDKEQSKGGKMAETWMAAAGQNGIPSAFLVDTKGTIAWIGHPMALQESVIEAVLDGKFDTQKAAAEYEQTKANEAKMATIGRQLSQAMEDKDWEAAEKKLAEMEKLLPAAQRANLGSMKFNLLLGKKDYPAAYKLAAEVSEAQKDNAMAQNDLAWRILTDESIEERDLKLAEKIATRANDAAKGKDPAILDTLARALFMNQQPDKAIELQKKAVALAEGDMKDSLQATLDSYQKGELPKAE